MGTSQSRPGNPSFVLPATKPSGTVPSCSVRNTDRMPIYPATRSSWSRLGGVGRPMLFTHRCV